MKTWRSCAQSTSRRCGRTSSAPWGSWDEDAQRERFFETTDPATHEVIERDGEPVGCRLVRRHADKLELVRLWLLPHAQREGIGTRLVSELIRDAAQNGLPVQLRVLKVNPARRLYARLGFRIIGENETHLRMRHDALSAPTTPPG